MFDIVNILWFETTIRAIISIFINVSYIWRDSVGKSLSFNGIYLKILYHDKCIIYLKIYRVVIIRSKDRDPSLVKLYWYDYSKMCGSEVMCSKKMYTPWSQIDGIIIIIEKFESYKSFLSQGSYKSFLSQGSS